MPRPAQHQRVDESGARTAHQPGRTARQIVGWGGLAGAAGVLWLGSYWLAGGFAEPVPHPEADASAPGPRATGAPSVAPSEPSVAEGRLDVAVDRLARDRAAALTAASVARLSTVNDVGSPAMTADVALIERLNALGLRLEGLRFEVRGIRELHAGSGTVQVEATVASSAHRQVAANGKVRATVPASPPRRIVLTLVPAASSNGWLVRQVSDARQ